MGTILLVTGSVMLTWFIAKALMAVKMQEAGRLVVITNERTGVQSLARLAQPLYFDQQYAIVQHDEHSFHLRNRNTIEFYTPDGEVINEVNWTLCKSPLKPFAPLRDSDTIDHY